MKDYMEAEVTPPLLVQTGDFGSMPPKDMSINVIVSHFVIH